MRGVTSKKGLTYYVVGPGEKSLRKFKEDIKAKTGKTLSKSFEQWTAELNPILRGKFNYFLIANRACRDVIAALKERGRAFHGIPLSRYQNLDGYVRQRLRVNFSCRGKKHGGVRAGMMLTVKYGNSFFCKAMKLVSGDYMCSLISSPELTIDDYLKQMALRNRRPCNENRKRFFRYAYAK